MNFKESTIIVFDGFKQRLLLNTNLECILIIKLLSNTNRKYNWKKVTLVSHRVCNWCNQNSNYAI